MTPIERLITDESNVQFLKNCFKGDESRLREFLSQKLCKLLQNAVQTVEETKEPVSFAMGDDAFGGRTFLVLPAKEAGLPPDIILKARVHPAERFPSDVPLAKGTTKLVYAGWNLTTHKPIVVTESTYEQQDDFLDARQEMLFLSSHPKRAIHVEESSDEKKHSITTIQEAGTPLLDLLRIPGLEVFHRLGLARTLIADLASLHEEGFIHGDIKPNNCIVFDTDLKKCRYPKAVLIDFGNVKKQDDYVEGKAFSIPGVYAAPELANLALARIIEGSPEGLESVLQRFRKELNDEPNFRKLRASLKRALQYTGPVFTQAQDVFSLGLVFLNLLTTHTQPPYFELPKEKQSGQLYEQLIYVILYQNAAKSCDDFLYGVPSDLSFLMWDMLSPHCEQRPTAAQVLKKFDEIMVKHFTLNPFDPTPVKKSGP